MGERGPWGAKDVMDAIPITAATVLPNHQEVAEGQGFHASQACLH